MLTVGCIRPSQTPTSHSSHGRTIFEETIKRWRDLSTSFPCRSSSELASPADDAGSVSINRTGVVYRVSVYSHRRCGTRSLIRSSILLQAANIFEKN